MNEYLQSTFHKTEAFKAGLPFPKIQYCSNLFFRWRAKLILIASLFKSDTRVDFGSQILNIQGMSLKTIVTVPTNHVCTEYTVLLLSAGGLPTDRLNPLLHCAICQMGWICCMSLEGNHTFSVHRTLDGISQ